jgi:hypothetical protein
MARTHATEKHVKSVVPSLKNWRDVGRGLFCAFHAEVLQAEQV